MNTIISDIKSIMQNIDDVEIDINTFNNIQSKNIIKYKNFLENIITEYHIVCKKLIYSI